MWQRENKQCKERADQLYEKLLKEQKYTPLFIARIIYTKTQEYSYNSKFTPTMGVHLGTQFFNNFQVKFLGNWP